MKTKKLKLTELNVQSFITSQEALHLTGGAATLTGCPVNDISRNDFCITQKYSGCLCSEAPLC